MAIVAPGHDVGGEVKKYVVVRANGANTGIILIGTTVSNVGDGFILSAGQISPPIFVDQLNKVYLKGGAADQGYSLHCLLDMKRIPLTQGKEALVDDGDYEYLMQWQWYAARMGKGFYAVRSVWRSGKQRTVLMHRAVTARAGLSGRQVDHRDRNALNNQRSNLRPATRAENEANQGLQCNNTSGAVGVHWDRTCQKWYARVRLGRLCAGQHFDDFDEAVTWRDAKAKVLHGEFAYLNEVA